MSYKLPALKLALSLTLLSVVPALTQTSEADSDAPSAAPVAYVYVQTLKGVNLYDAAANGKLTLVEGSPFNTVGEMIGSNGKYFITLDDHNVHSYTLEPNGAIGKQVSEINTQKYAGAECGPYTGASGANMDHTGQDAYVVISADGWCTAIQTFEIAKGSGELAFKGEAVPGGNAGSGIDPPSIIGNDTFAYAPSDFGCCGNPPGWSGFVRKSDGTMEEMTFNISAGSGLTLPFGYVPYSAVTADPTNHIAAIVSLNSGEGVYAPPQIASYTVDSKGNFSTTSTKENMPYTKIYPTSMNMSPSGELLAVAGSSEGYPTPPGLQIFHFNGADPVTAYSKVLTSSLIYKIHWDNNDHLYALGGPGLYVYAITPTSIAEAPGSPYTIQTEDEKSCIQGSGGCPNGLIVVPTP